jgi:hypothetical protein
MNLIATTFHPARIEKRTSYNGPTVKLRRFPMIVYHSVSSRKGMVFAHTTLTPVEHWLAVD